MPVDLTGLESVLLTLALGLVPILSLLMLTLMLGLAPALSPPPDM